MDRIFGSWKKVWPLDAPAPQKNLHFSIVGFDDSKPKMFQTQLEDLLRKTRSLLIRSVDNWSHLRIGNGKTHHSGSSSMKHHPIRPIKIGETPMSETFKEPSFLHMQFRQPAVYAAVSCRQSLGP